MNRIFMTLFMLIPATATSCSGPVVSEADQRITSTSPQGLAAFFTRECLEQAGASKARAQYQKAMDSCYGDSKCEDNVPAEIAWIVPGPNKQNLEVIYDWRWIALEPPSQGRLGCSVAVSNQLESNLRASIARLNIDGHGFIKTENKYAFDLLDSIESWREDTTPALILTLQHYPSPDQPDAGPVPAKDSYEYDRYLNDMKNVKAELRLHAARPWRLKVGVEDNQP